MNPKTNEPAFPSIGISAVGSTENNGMSLRDYFAAKAMQGLLSNDEFIKSAVEMFEKYEIDVEKNVAVTAYHHADAMIAQRDK